MIPIFNEPVRANIHIVQIPKYNMATLENKITKK